MTEATIFTPIVLPLLCNTRNVFSTRHATKLLHGNFLLKYTTCNKTTSRQFPFQPQCHYQAKFEIQLTCWKGKEKSVRKTCETWKIRGGKIRIGTSSWNWKIEVLVHYNENALFSSFYPIGLFSILRLFVV